MDEDRDVFSARLEHDRRLRKVAAFIIPDLLALDYEDAMAAIGKARKLVRMMDGGQGPVRAISAQAAALYARLPLECPSDALRTLHIIEVFLRYIEEGVVDWESAKEIVVYLGAPTGEAKHLRIVVPNAPANDVELLMVPDVLPAQAND